MRPLRPLAAIALLVVLGAPRRSDADVGDYLGKPVVSVRVETEGRATEDGRLLQLVETRPGEPLSMAAVRESITHLFSLGRFEDVRVDAELERDGVALRYELIPVHPITRIEFRGTSRIPGVDQSGLRSSIAERYGTSLPVGRAGEIARLVESELGTRGYRRARATADVALEHNPDRATLMLTIDPGPRTRIGAVDIVGAPPEDVPQLLARLGMRGGAPFEVESLNERLDSIGAEYRRRGYYEARAQAIPRFSDDDRTVNLTITVTPGPLVRVVFDGDPLPADRREELVPIAREGSADEDLLEDSTNRIEASLRAQGYRDAAAPHTREVVDGELRIRFDVRRGRHYRVDDVVISGNDAIPLLQLQQSLALRRGDPFDPARVRTGADAIEDLYRRRGFADVRVTPSIETRSDLRGAGDIGVTVGFIIAAGVRTTVRAVRIEDDVDGVAPPSGSALTLQPGLPFLLGQLAVDRDAIQQYYADRGYLNATVSGAPGLSEDGTQADVVYTVRAGPRVFVDHVLIVGNDRIRAETIEQELQIRPGDPLGLAAVNESQRRLAALGLFRRTRILQLGHGDETTRDVLVSVEEAAPTTIGYGGGLELAQRFRRREATGVPASARLEFAPRAFFEVTRRNLFGKNRSVNLFTRISLRPKDSPFFTSAPADPDSSGFGFSEYRVLATFREPRVLDTTAEALLTGAVEQQVRSSFNFARRAFSAEVARRLGRSVNIGGNYQIQRTELFDERIDQSEKLLIDRLFPQVRLSSFSVSVSRDTRDDPFGPAAGHYLSANGQVAARRIGSEVGLTKSTFTAQMFQTLPRTNRIVFAASARFGVATAFSRRVVRTDSNGQPVLASDGQPIVDVVQEVPASERFFAGGDTTVRGFVLDQLGTPETIDQDGFPIGGNGLSVFNAELRVPVRGGLGAVGFLDAGNVFARATDINLGELRSAVGVGIRYQSPVGPIRVDVGFKTNRRDIVPGVPEKLAVWHISLGQAF
jgi:outer membrane protein insertion porin family